MPAKRLSMRKIKEVLRLKWAQGLSNRRIAASSGIGRPTVSEYLRRAEEAGIADRTTGVYVADITVGETRVLRGHWADRLADIDADIDYDWRLNGSSGVASSD